MKKEEDKVTKMLKNAQKIITLFVICKYSKHETKKTSLQCKIIFYIGVDHITSNFWRYTSVSLFIKLDSTWSIVQRPFFSPFGMYLLWI